MSHPVEPPEALYFVSAFGRKKETILLAVEALRDLLGPIRKVSSWYPFDYTDYYEEEFGSPLFKAFFFFELLPQDKLVEVKHRAYEVEKEFSKDGRRQVNLDPGYLLLSRVVLSTFKDFSHRIYLGRGVFAEVTLIFRDGSFRPLPWTYPDYSSEEVINLFNEVRREYKELLRC